MDVARQAVPVRPIGRRRLLLVVLGCGLLWCLWPVKLCADWWTDNRLAAEQLERRGDDRRAGEIYALLAEQAARYASGEWEGFARWKKALCDARLGHYQAAETALEKLVAAQPKHGMMLLWQRDLGELELRSLEVVRARPHLQEARRLAPAGWTFQGRQVPLSPLQQARIAVMEGQCLVISGQNAQARSTLDAVRAQLVQDKTASPLGESLLCECDLYLADLDWRAGNTLGSLARLAECEKRLADKALAGLPRTPELQKSLASGLAGAYARLCRFSDALTVLGSAEQKARTANNNLFLRDLSNTRAQVDLDQAWCLLQGDGHSEQVDESLQAASQAAGQALACHAKVSAEPSIATANSHSLLAKVEELRGRVFEAARDEDAAQQAYRKALASAGEALPLFRSTFGDDHDIVLELTRQLATLKAKVGQRDAACQDVNRVLEKFAKRYGADSMECWPCYEQLIEMEGARGNVQAARHNAEQHRRISHDKLASFITALTPIEQQEFFRRWDDPGLHGSLRLAAGQPELWQESIEWLLNGKARSSELLAQDARQASHSPLAAAFRSALEQQAFCLYDTSSQGHDAVFVEQERAKRALKAKIEALHRQQRTKGGAWDGQEALGKRLDQDEVFIDLFCLRDAHGASRTYHAWVVTAGGPTKVVRLADAAEVDPLVLKLLQRLENCNRPGSIERERGMSAGESALRAELLRPLSRMILWPLREAAGDRTRWIISPDGLLWNLPWGALVAGQRSDEYAVGLLSFRQVISGRDLEARAAARPVQLGKPLVIADPEYGSLAETGFDLPPLEGSRAEGEQIAAQLTGAKLPPDLRMGKEASKRALFGLAAPPHTLYISTHGFFCPPWQTHTSNMDDPFLCCGLLLAPEKAATVAPGSPNTQLSGLVTGAEVLTLDLSGTEMVVLSACQTGLGATTYGQSAASLRHAFHLAGAKSVVASLWSINDKETSELMVGFMRRALEPAADKADALRAAQREMQARHPHPFYWAAFTLSGF